MLLPKLLIALAGTIALVALPSAAQAADTTVGFGELGLADSTAIHDQFANGYGVRFGSPTRFGFPAPEDNLNCGTPYLRYGALNGTALDISCASGPSEFPIRRFATAMEFQNEQRRVSFKFKNNTPHTQTAITKFYAIGSSTPLTTLTTVVSSGATATIAYDKGSNLIIGAVIHSYQVMDWYDSGGVFVDDLVMTRDAQPLTPKYTVALQQPATDVIEGSSADVPVSVRRYNGSNGPVTLTVGSIPAGIASTQFRPDATATGSDPVTLRITAKSPFTGHVQLLVSASGGGSAGTGVNVTNLVQTVTGVPALYFATGGRFPIRLVPGCGLQKIDDSFGVRGTFSGYTSYNFGGTRATSGLAQMQTGGPVYPHGAGNYPIEYLLDPGPNDGSGKFTVQADPYGATEASISLNWMTDRLTINQLPNTSPALPLVDGGSTARVIGHFPLNCPVKFVDAAGQEWPKVDSAQTEVGGRLLDELTLSLPATAVSGPLKAINSAGVEMARSEPIDVREFRRTYVLMYPNSGVNAGGTYSWDDFESTFGSDDTDWCVLVCVHDPVASHYYDTYKAQVEAAKGLCFGYAVMAARFRGYGTGQTPSRYVPGAVRAWDLAPFYNGGVIKQHVVRWFVAQFDKGTYASYEKGKTQSAADEKRLLRDLLSQQGAAVIAIRQGEEGHAVTAYAMRDTTNGSGGMVISIYDPNNPYSFEESTNSQVRASNLRNSEINVGADGTWKFRGLGWSGHNSTLIVYPNIPPLNASLPATLSIASIFATSGGTSPAQISGIEYRGKPQIDTDGEPTKGSSVDLVPTLSGAGAEAQYTLRKGREYELTIKGSGKGAYDSSLLTGSATASVHSVDTAKGQIDRVTIRPGEASLQFATGAKRSGVTYDLVSRRGKVTRTASINATAREGSSDEAELSGSTLRIAHDGSPTKISITLGSVGAGLPSNATTPKMTIGRGQKLDIKPGKWSELSSKVNYTLRAKSGRVIRRGKVRMHTSGKLALGKLKAKRKGNKLTVSGSVKKRGSAPVLVAVATVTKHGKRVRRKTARLSGSKVEKGKFSLSVKLGKLPRGAKVKVDVVLTDPTGGGATTHKKIRVR